MITQAIFSIIFRLLETLFNWLPLVDTLPWGIDAILIMAVGLFKAFVAIFPPMQIVFEAFLIYIGFRIILKLLRMIPFVGRAMD